MIKVYIVLQNFLGTYCDPLLTISEKNRQFLMPLQQTTFEIILANEEIAHNEQFLYLPQWFQLYSIIILSFIEFFNILNLLISKSSAADLL